jgi:hypothetical protein
MTRPGIPLPDPEWQHGYQNVLRPEELLMTSPQNPESGADTFGGPDPGPEDELAAPGDAGADTLGGPDRGDEDELRPEG